MWSRLERLPRLSFAWNCSSRPSSADLASVPCAFPLLFLVSYLLWLCCDAERLSLARHGRCTPRRRIACEYLVLQLEYLLQRNFASWSIQRAVLQVLRLFGRSTRVDLGRASNKGQQNGAVLRGVCRSLRPTGTELFGTAGNECKSARLELR